MEFNCKGCEERLRIDESKYDVEEIQVNCPSCGYENKVKLSDSRQEVSAAEEIVNSLDKKKSFEKGQRQRIKFSGSMGQLMGLYWGNIILSILTLGIYSFWGKVKITRFFYQSTSFMGEHFDYHATGKEKFIAFLKAIAILIPAYIVLTLFSRLLVEIFGRNGIFIYLIILYGIILSVIPLVQIGARRFLLARSSYRGLRFKFHGNVKEYLPIFWKHLVLTIITLGIYSPWFYNAVQTYFINHSSYGNESFSYNGNSKEIFFIYLKGILLSIITLGIYAFWMEAQLERYIWSHTKFQGIPMSSDITGGQLFGATFLAMLVTIFSLGIAAPIGMYMMVEVYLKAMALEGTPDFKKIEADVDKGASAFSDGISEGADVLSDIFG